jgi:hypothetical protein
VVLITENKHPPKTVQIQISVTISSVNDEVCHPDCPWYYRPDWKTFPHCKLFDEVLECDCSSAYREYECIRGGQP